MLSAWLAVCGGLLESTTWTVKLDVPVPAGEPVIAPVLAVSVRGEGKAPEMMLHVNGPCPPLSPRVWLYGVATVPFGSEVVVITGAGGKLTAMLRA